MRLVVTDASGNVQTTWQVFFATATAPKRQGDSTIQSDLRATMELDLPKEGIGTEQSRNMMLQIAAERVSFMRSVNKRIRFWEDKVERIREKLQQRQSKWQSRHLALAHGKLRLSRQGKQALCCHAWRYDQPDEPDSKMHCPVCRLASDQFDTAGKFKGEELDYSGVGYE